MAVSTKGYDQFEAEATMLDTPKVPLGDSFIDTPSNLNWVGFGFIHEEEKVKNYDHDIEINAQNDSLWLVNEWNSNQLINFDSKIELNNSLVSSRLRQLPPIESKKSAWTSTINWKEDDEDEEMPLRPTRTELK